MGKWFFVYTIYMLSFSFYIFIIFYINLIVYNTGMQPTQIGSKERLFNIQCGEQW